MAQRDDYWTPSSGSESESADDILSEFSPGSNLHEEPVDSGNELRPCIAVLAKTPLDKDDWPDRTICAVALAAEYVRIGMNETQVAELISEWNQRHSPPLKQEELDGIVASAVKWKYRYSCDHRVLAHYCVGSSCPCRPKFKRDKIKARNYRFIDYGWPHLLSRRQVIIYFLGLPYLEVDRKVGPGGSIYVSQQELADICGMPKRRIGNDLERLSSVGLIDYKPGTPRVWEHRASVIQRVLPIPRPPSHWDKLTGVRR